MRDAVHPVKMATLASDFARGQVSENELLDELLEQGILNPVERRYAKAEKMRRNRVCVTWGNPTEHLVFRVT